LHARLAPLAAALTFSACAHAAGAGAAPLWSLADPPGDDHGDGDLTYPGRGDPAPGELDLLALRALREADGTTFEATFARPIRRPDGRTVSSTGASLSEVAPLGFYGLNLDVYVDVDRVPGSGRVDSLPGRKLAFAAEGAWDRAVVLTPRPAEAMALLRALWTRAAKRERAGRSMSGREEEALEREVAAEAERRVFFPRRVRVAGATVSFFVPAAFLPGGADPAYAYAAAVTGADLDLRLDIRAIFQKDAPTRGLFLLPIAPGHRIDFFGGGRIDDPDQPPVVDLLAAGLQEATLLARPPLVRGIVPAEASR